MPYYTNTPKQNWQHAKSMRRNPTAAEKKLWSALRRHQLGIQFRRQYPIDNYIVDFAASSINLIIEVDGDTHAGAAVQVRDTSRTEHLTSLGFRVIRFANSDVLSNLSAVVEVIKGLLATPLNPPATRGGRSE
ncbi:endonuclease domain-containing protein [bacterium]|nr:MAG: endonuclease domain-containing protein [bacterium]